MQTLSSKCRCYFLAYACSLQVYSLIAGKYPLKSKLEMFTGVKLKQYYFVMKTEQNAFYFQFQN